MGGGAVPVPLRGAGQKEARRPGGHRAGGLGQGGGGDDQVIALAAGLLGEGLGQGGQVAVVGAKAGDGRRHALHEAGVHLLQKGDELVAHPVAGEGVVGIGAVLHVGDAVFRQVGFDIGTGGGEEGADVLPADRVDAGEAGKAAAPEQVQEHRFGVVAGVVGGGDAAASQPEGLLGEEAVAQGPGGLLQAQLAAFGLGPHVPPAHGEGDAPPGADVTDEGLVPDALFATELVVIVGGGHGDVPSPGEGVEQAHGVGPAGDGAEDFGAGGEHMVLPDELLHPWKGGGFNTHRGGGRRR